MINWKIAISAIFLTLRQVRAATECFNFAQFRWPDDVVDDDYNDGRGWWWQQH